MSKTFIGITPPEFSAVVAERIARNGSQSHVAETKIKLQDFGLVYGTRRNSNGEVISRAKTVALQNISIDIPAGKVTSMLGPSGCGKSTLLRAINLIHLTSRTVTCSFSGSIHLDNDPVILNGTAACTDPVLLRKRVGMIFQEPSVFPKSTIFKNVALGITLWEKLGQRELNNRVCTTLEEVGLYDEVKNKLHGSAEALSGGQQQRLCIARTIAVNPEVILMDEPTSKLDPISTAIIENLIEKLQKEHGYTIVIVTHNIQQAARVSDYCAVLIDGKLVEYGDSAQMFMRPQHKNTRNYLMGYPLEDDAADRNDLTREALTTPKSPMNDGARLG